MSERKSIKPKPQVVELKKAPQAQAEADLDTGFGFGLGKMRELAEAFTRAVEIKDQAMALEEMLRASRIEARDEYRSIVYMCDGVQKPIAVVIQPEAIAGRSAEEVSERLQVVLREGYRCSKAHMLTKSQELVGDFESSYWEQQQESLRQKEQSGAISFVREPEEGNKARAKAK